MPGLQAEERLITPITTGRKQRRFSTYDFEWSAKPEPGSTDLRRLKLRVAGVFDGQNYRCFRTIEEFLNAILVRENNGRWFYAHAGGLADMVFVLQKLVESRRYRVSASFSGSSAIIVHVEDVRWEGTGKERVVARWHFVDSYWLLRAPLADIAQWIGMEKGKVDFETENEMELIEYNRLDCEILWKAIYSFENSILEIGGQLQMTLASCAMYLFRRKYLKREVATNLGVNANCRISYFGSRVEVIQKRCWSAKDYDINSSFPHAMTFPAPGSVKDNGRKIPKSFEAQAEPLFMADCEVEVRDCYLPPLPYRNRGSVFFPTGRWRSWFMGIDLQLLQESGVGRILHVHEVKEFEPFDDLGSYARDLYDRRRKGTTGFEKIVYKLLLNSLYGKFAENSLKTSLKINPPFTTCPHWPEHPDSSCMDMLFPGVWLIDDEVEVAHSHVPISSHITATARRALWRFMMKGRPVYYCDTDGFVTGQDFETSEELGDLKLVREVKEGVFVAPKVYRLDRKVKAKGFSLRDKRLLPKDTKEDQVEDRLDGIAYDRFAKLADGKYVETWRMTRIRELYRKGRTDPVETMIRKKLIGARTKRSFLANGDSRPWTVKELDVPMVKKKGSG